MALQAQRTTSTLSQAGVAFYSRFGGALKRVKEAFAGVWGDPATSVIKTADLGWIVICHTVVADCAPLAMKPLLSSMSLRRVYMSSHVNRITMHLGPWAIMSLHPQPMH